MLCFYVKYRVLRFFSYLCTQNIIVMVDKRTLEFILTDQAQVVIGVRRSGKSTLCYQAMHNHSLKFAYADFDDERLVDLKADQLNDVLEILYKIYGDFQYLFLDEIQNVVGWHLFVNRMLRKKMHVIITGSNAKLLSGELASHHEGRGIPQGCFRRVSEAGWFP